LEWNLCGLKKSKINCTLVGESKALTKRKTMPKENIPMYDYSDTPDFLDPENPFIDELDDDEAAEWAELVAA